ncbi:MAG: type II toxin-antitoxin system VapC family toxin [Micrococcales bacterium]
MGTLILDTSVAVALEQGVPSVVSAVTGHHVILPAVVLAETLTATWLAKDDDQRQRRRRLTQLLEDSTELAPFGAREADALAELRSFCLVNGKKRGQYDLMIAAHAVAARGTLLTRDRRARFEELPGVAVEYFD